MISLSKHLLTLGTMFHRIITWMEFCVKEPRARFPDLLPPAAEPARGAPAASRDPPSPIETFAHLPIYTLRVLVAPRPRLSAPLTSTPTSPMGQDCQGHASYIIFPAPGPAPSRSCLCDNHFGTDTLGRAASFSGLLAVVVDAVVLSVVSKRRILPGRLD